MFSKAVVGLAFLAILVGWASMAIAEEKFYLKAGVGFYKQENSDLSNQSPSLSAIARGPNAKVKYGTGFTYNAAVGYNLFTNGRAELEFARFSTNLGQLNSSTGTANLEGYSRIYAYMLNGYYDFVIKEFPVVPYLGFGLGAASQSVDIQKQNGVLSGLRPSGDTMFAYQAKAGLSYKIADRLITEVGYRYFATDNANIGYVQIGNQIHSFEFGIRWMAF